MNTSLDCFWPLLLASAPPRREGRVADRGQNVGVHLRHVRLHAADVCGELGLLGDLGGNSIGLKIALRVKLKKILV